MSAKETGRPARSLASNTPASSKHSRTAASQKANPPACRPNAALASRSRPPDAQPRRLRRSRSDTSTRATGEDVGAGRELDRRATQQHENLDASLTVTHEHDRCRLADGDARGLGVVAIRGFGHPAEATGAGAIGRRSARTRRRSAASRADRGATVASPWSSATPPPTAVTARHRRAGDKRHVGASACPRPEVPPTPRPDVPPTPRPEVPPPPPPRVPGAQAASRLRHPTADPSGPNWTSEQNATASTTVPRGPDAPPNGGPPAAPRRRPVRAAARRQRRAAAPPPSPPGRHSTAGRCGTASSRAAPSASVW